MKFWFGDNEYAPAVVAGDGESYTLYYVIPRDHLTGKRFRDLVEALPIDVYATPPSDYSPTGRWFHRQAWVSRHQSFIVIEQSYSLDC